MSISSRFKKFFFPTDEVPVVKKETTQELVALPTLMTFAPTSFKEAGEIASQLLQVGNIVVDISALSGEEGRRTLDFLSGVIFSMKGTIKTSDRRRFEISLPGRS